MISSLSFLCVGFWDKHFWYRICRKIGLLAGYDDEILDRNSDKISDKICDKNPTKFRTKNPTKMPDEIPDKKTIHFWDHETSKIAEKAERKIGRILGQN